MWCMLMHLMGHQNHSSHAEQTSVLPAEHQSLFDILKRRYALGEITREQFEEMNRVLRVTEAAPAVAPSAQHAHH